MFTKCAKAWVCRIGFVLYRNRCTRGCKMSSKAVDDTFEQLVVLKSVSVFHDAHNCGLQRVNDTPMTNIGCCRLRLSYAAFTPDTCSPGTSCIHLYPFVSPVAVCVTLTLYPVSATKLSSRRHVSTFIHLYPNTSCLSGILVSGYMYLV